MSSTSKWLIASSAVVIGFAVLIKNVNPILRPELPKLAAETFGASSKEEAIDRRPLSGVNIAITGATSGIGLGLTRYLHGLGATIIAIGRSPSKLAALQNELDDESQHGDNRGGRVETVLADLTNLSSVAEAAQDITSRFDSIDVLVNNAGIAYHGQDILSFQKEHSTTQGYDVGFQVNYLSHFLLTEKLLPLLQKSTKSSPRIIQMSSSFHWLTDGTDVIAIDVVGKMTEPPRASLGDARSFFQRERSYANSKLAQILHARALSRRLNNDDGSNNIKVISVCPGWVGTNVAGSSGLLSFVLKHIAYPNDGYGLASTLEAMFLPEAGSDNSKDYFVNSAYFEYLGMAVSNMGLIGRAWPAQTGFRDLLSWTFAIVLLFTQKLGSGTRQSFSSPESYNVTAQENLYQWSKEAVSEWL